MRMRRISILACSLLLPALAVPALAQKDDPSAKNQGSSKAASASGSRAQAAPQAATSDPAYVIGASDELNISVWEQPDLSRTVPVRPDGMISLPLINDVQASGKTPMQLAAMITQKLSSGLVKDPQVTVIVTAINSQRIYVLGQVQRPGAFPMLPDMTVLQAISSAGGLLQFAKQKGIYVLRTENGKQMHLPFDYKDVLRGSKPEQNIVLKVGDTIVVP